jgi:hypothetical protein
MYTPLLEDFDTIQKYQQHQRKGSVVEDSDDDDEKYLYVGNAAVAKAAKNRVKPVRGRDVDGPGAAHRSVVQRVTTRSGRVVKRIIPAGSA